MTKREALAALAAGKVVRVVHHPESDRPGMPIFHDPTKGFVCRQWDGRWLQFGANLAADEYELVTSVPPPAKRTDE